MPVQQRSHERLIDRADVRWLLADIDRQAAAGPAQPLETWLDLARMRLAERTDIEGDADHATTLLASLARRFAHDLAGFRTALALGAEVDTWDPRAERISLLTLHAAKGLEFPAVFLIGLEDGMVPSSWIDDGEDPERIAEERRLFFVGLTRARRHLFLSSVRRRPWRGEIRDARPSRFLDAIDPKLVEWHQASARRPRREAKDDGGEQLSLID